MQYLNNKYALTLHKSGTQLSTAHGTPLSGIKLAHDVA